MPQPQVPAVVGELTAAPEASRTAPDLTTSPDGSPSARDGVGSPDPPATAHDLTAALEALIRGATVGEDALFGVIPILGEPSGQRELDGWVDTAVDLLRAVAEAAQELDARAHR
ncbi:MAG: hypothetical protein LCH66_02345 [Actinobacteria bacterium]|nr:hypothetical protein [Actinomycetota bacterium]